MWRSLVGLRPLARNVFSNGARRFFSVRREKKPSRMAQLAKEYGWTATGIYLALSVADYPLAYLLVHSAGQDKMEDAEIAVRKLIGADPERDNTYIHKAASGGKSLLWTELGIAYIIHKFFPLFRIPLTVAITPAIARKLGQWGFNVKRAMPSIDKSQFASQIAAKAESSNSATIRKAADSLSKETKRPSTEILNEAAKVTKNGKPSEAIKKAAEEAQQNIKQKAGRFGE